MRYFCILAALIFVICTGNVSADSSGLPQEIREGHFTFRLPKGFTHLEPEDLPSLFFPDTPRGRVYKKRLKDLDTVFVAKEDNSSLFFGFKVRPYRKRLRKALSYEEFASTENINAYKRALSDQLQRQGLSKVSVKGPVTSRQEGVVQFTCEFESADGLEAEEYYASVLGSHEVVYLILFSSPPIISSEIGRLFHEVLDSFEFEQKYQYRRYPQNWWQQRTWGERTEDVLKLLALSFVLYLGFVWGLDSMFRSRLRLDPRTMRGAIRVMSILLSLIVCLAVFKWVQF
ncbi:MAG: hypothetical protein HWN68_08840 [Desulfobacterales bacterium]|nr:hypothetical protein [Desulfobacterales bacterium]